MEQDVVRCGCGCGKWYTELQEDFPLRFEIVKDVNPWGLPKGKQFMGRLAPEHASGEQVGDFVFIGHWPVFFHGKRYCGNLADGYARIVEPVQPHKGAEHATIGE